MSSNVGVGIGAFLNGLSNGAKVYSDIATAKQQREINGMKITEMKDQYAENQEYKSILRSAGNDASSARDADINAKITPSAQEGPPAYMVGDQQYADPAKAKAEAEKQVGNYTDYWMKTAAPKLQEHWMKTGQTDKAQNFNKWLEDSDVQKGLKSWAGMARSYSVGDKTGFLNGLNETLSHEKYYQGAVKPVSAEENRDSQGRITGYKVKFKNADTGDETTQDFDGNDVQKMMVLASSPGQVYEQQVNEMNATKAARAKAADTFSTRQYETGKEATKQGYDIERDNNKSQLNKAEEAEKARLGVSNSPLAKVKAVEGYLKSKGYDDKYIADHAPAMVGIQNQNKPTSTRIEDYVKTQTENSREFRKKSPDEKIAEAREYIDTVDQAAGKGEQSQPQGMSISPPPQQQSQGRGVPVYDTQTGKVIYR